MFEEVDRMNAHVPPTASNPRGAIAPSQVIALGLVVVSIGWAVWLLQDRPHHEEVELLSGSKLPSSELAIMEAAFDRAQLTDYRSEDGRVWVPRARQSAYMRALVDAEALPREFGGSLRRALESNSPWQSKAVQEEMLRVATQEELSLVICSMPGIERAAVLYDVDNAASSGSLRATSVKTASVSVRTQPDTDLDPTRIEAIRVLVASSIAGLAADRVAVTDLRNGRVHAGPLDGTADLSELDPRLARRAAHERHLLAKVQRAIAFVKGATVDVTVDFEPEERPAQYDAAPATEATLAVNALPPQPAAAANAPAEVAPPPAAVPTPELPPADVLATVLVAIAVPDTHFAEGAADADAVERELDRIRRHVLPLLPATQSADGHRVVVTTFATPASHHAVMRPATTAALEDSRSVEPPAQPQTPPAADGRARFEAAVAKLIDALADRLDGTTEIKQQEWLAGMSVAVGLLAGWLWWAGGRRRLASHPSIDWAQVGSPHIGSRGNASEPRFSRGPVADREPLERVAA
jgi:type III secretory pathway lipoprotein EscJ